MTVPGTAPTVNELAETLAGALESRACLLVVDDLWATEHLRPFTARGSRCRLPLTTRNAALARQFGARIHPVHAMAHDEALRLLEAWADEHLAGVPASTKDAIVDELGGLPLAIKLAGAQLQRVPAGEWLTTFEGARGLDTGWGAIDRDSSLAICLHLSMAALDDRARRLYAGLGTPELGPVGHRGPAACPLPGLDLAVTSCGWLGTTATTRGSPPAKLRSRQSSSRQNGDCRGIALDKAGPVSVAVTPIAERLAANERGESIQIADAQPCEPCPGFVRISDDPARRQDTPDTQRRDFHGMRRRDAC